MNACTRSYPPTAAPAVVMVVMSNEARINPKAVFATSAAAIAVRYRA